MVNPSLYSKPAPNSPLESMALNFEDIHDPRRSKSVTYPLGEIFFISLCAMLSGAEAFTEFRAYGVAQEPWLKKRLPLVNGIPSHDTFRAVFGLIDTNAFNQFFIRWTQGLRKLEGHDLIALDGKSLRGSCREQAVHLVNAWASGDNLILGEMKTQKKSNEITAIPQLLEQLELNGSIVTIDAMGTQKTIVKTIEEAGASYVLCLKNNHPKLHGNVEEFMEDSRNAGLMDFHEHSRKDHGRQATWRYSIAECPEWLPNLLRSRATAQQKTCVANLMQINGAKQRWAIDENKRGIETPGETDLAGGNLYMKEFPTCPSGGIYVTNAVEVDPTCSLSASHGHSL